jgi:aminoglycoside phosphotransferase (APT) family kinase protein
MFPCHQISGIRRLRGGLDATTHRFDATAPDGTVRPLVVRRSTHPWAEPGDVASHARVLDLLVAVGAPAPAAVAIGEDGACFGVQTIVMTRLPGRSVVDPAAGEWWLPGLAATLAGIHAIGGDPLAPLPSDEDGIPRSIDRADERARGAQARTLVATVRERAAALIAGGTPGRLVHRDFHAGNVLFHRNRPAGVVDWASARRGYPARDVGYCRLDLALMASGDAPDVFLSEYERATGAPVEDLAFWDLLGCVSALPDPVEWLPSWLEWGRTDLTPALLRRRFRRFVEDAMRRL